MNAISLCVFCVSLLIKICAASARATPHIRIRTSMSTLELITVGVLALMLCVVLTFAAYFIHLRISVNRHQTDTCHESSPKHNYNISGMRSALCSYKTNHLSSVDELQCNATSDTTSLLKRSNRMTYDCAADCQSCVTPSSYVSGYVSFGIYGGGDDKDAYRPLD